MKKFTHVIITCFAICGAQTASAALLTFEDVPGGSIQDEYGNMPVYMGFDFSSTLDWIDVGGPSYDYGAHNKSDFALINNVGNTGIIIEASTADFTFDGLWAKRMGTPPESGGEDSLFGTLSGYLDGSLVWQVATGLNGSYEYYHPQAGLIDELRLGFGNYFLVDDIELNAVPIPASAWLFGSGLLSLAGMLRRKTRA